MRKSKKGLYKLIIIQVIFGIIISLYMINADTINNAVFFYRTRNLSVQEIQDRIASDEKENKHRVIEPEYGDINTLEAALVKTITNTSKSAVNNAEIYLLNKLFQYDLNSFSMENTNELFNLHTPTMEFASIGFDVDMANSMNIIPINSLEPGESKIFESSIVLNLQEKTYNIQPSAITSYDSRSFLYTYYTRPEEYIQSTKDTIKAIAGEITGKHTNPGFQARAIYDFIIENIEFVKVGTKQQPVQVLEAGKGDSFGISTLFASLARASGIPARLVSGYAPDSGHYKYHMWNEVFFNEYGWIPVDIVWGQKTNRNYFGYMDNKHIPIYYGYVPIFHTAEGNVLEFEHQLIISSISERIVWEQETKDIVNNMDEYVAIYDRRIIEGVLTRNIQAHGLKSSTGNGELYLQSPGTANTDYSTVTLVNSSKAYNEFDGDISLLAEDLGYIDPFSRLNIYSIELNQENLSLSIEEEIHAEVHTVIYNLDESVITPYDTNSYLYKAYTSPQPYIQSDDRSVVKTAADITEGLSNPLTKSRQIFDYILSSIQIGSPEGGKPGALSALKGGRGSNLEFSTLYAALTRASGIPSRIVSGMAPYMGKYSPHIWVEIYFNEYGWIPVDPFYSKLYDLDFFGHITNKHIPMYYGLNEYLYLAHGSNLSIEVQLDFNHKPSSEKLKIEYEEAGKNYIEPALSNRKELKADYTIEIRSNNDMHLQGVSIYSPALGSANNYYSKITRLDPYKGFDVFTDDVELLIFSSILFDVNSHIQVLKLEDLAADFTYTINETLLIELSEVKYNLNRRIITPYDEVSELFRIYTQPGDGIESSHPEIISLAQSIVKDEQNPLLKSRKIYNYVIANLTYRVMDEEHGALYALKNSEGDCTEFTALFVALNRAAGIPARYITGYALDHNFKDPQGHAWAEVYFNEYGWVPVDPTWGQGTKKDYFGYIDNRHIAVNYSFYDFLTFFHGEGNIIIDNTLNLE